MKILRVPFTPPGRQVLHGMRMWAGPGTRIGTKPHLKIGLGRGMRFGIVTFVMSIGRGTRVHTGPGMRVRTYRGLMVRLCPGINPGVTFRLDCYEG